MFNLSETALNIKAVLEGLPKIETATFIDRDDETFKHPVTMPAAFVAMEKLTTPGLNRKTTIPQISWVVIVRSKRLQGPDGCLHLADLIQEKLNGLSVAQDTEPLRLTEISFYDKRGGSIAYAVRFTANMISENKNMSCFFAQ